MYFATIKAKKADSRILTQYSKMYYCKFENVFKSTHYLLLNQTTFWVTLTLSNSEADTRLKFVNFFFL